MPASGGKDRIFSSLCGSGSNAILDSSAICGRVLPPLMELDSGGALPAEKYAIGTQTVTILMVTEWNAI